MALGSDPGLYADARSYTRKLRSACSRRWDSRLSVFRVDEIMSASYLPCMDVGTLGKYIGSRALGSSKGNIHWRLQSTITRKTRVI